MNALIPKRSWILVPATAAALFDWAARRRSERMPRYWQLGFPVSSVPAWRSRSRRNA
jgi:hypothetical protein